MCALDVVKATEILLGIELLQAKDGLATKLNQVCQDGFGQLNRLLSDMLENQHNKLERFSSPKSLELLRILKESSLQESG